MDIMYLKQNKYTPSNIYQSLGIASAKVGVNRSINWLNENILTWNKTFKDIHSLNILGGFTIQRNNVESVTGASSNFVNDVMKYNKPRSRIVFMINRNLLLLNGALCLIWHVLIIRYMTSIYSLLTDVWMVLLVLGATISMDFSLRVLWHGVSLRKVLWNRLKLSLII